MGSSITAPGKIPESHTLLVVKYAGNGVIKPVVYLCFIALTYD